MWYVLATEKGDPGDVYNVCSGTPYTMQTILDTLIRLSTVPIRVNVDPQRVRPVEIPTLYGNYSHLRERTGWQPQIAIEQSLQDVLEQWRVRTT
jgi:GDP-4-dehydro-6-deoxy-D-mannose reductase